MEMKMRQFYTNPAIKFIFNKRIYEYDIEQAGLHALRAQEEISEETYRAWKNLRKDKLVYYIGKTLGDTMKGQNEWISKIVQKFITINNIPAHQIISQKRDALFIFDIIPTHCTIDGFRFVCKGSYSSYLLIHPYELYYHNEAHRLTIKGIPNEQVQTHALIPYLIECIAAYERRERNLITYRELYQMIASLKEAYTRYALPLDCYRELGNENLFCLYDSVYKRFIHVTAIPNPTDCYRLVSSHNFKKFIIPFISLLPRYVYTGGKS
jgi:hypothetical protein